MITRLERVRRRFRRLVSRSWWTVRLFRLARAEGPAVTPGLLLVQIDGLSHTQFERALAAGRLPFLKSLLEEQHYLARPTFAGIPSTTPAVQAELLFGIRRAVPAFGFVRRDRWTDCFMYDAGCVTRLARRLTAEGRPLLVGGTSYSNIFGGGAGEARFCAETLEPEALLAALNPFKTSLLVAAHAGKLLRIAGLAVIEFGLALYDFVRGIMRRRDFVKELKFVPTRIGVSIVLRELIRLHVKIDVVRGVPVIHANFVGYDEQSHRRGPASAFAHWCLKGIDGTIRDCYRSAHRTLARDYRVIVYSDHGQEKAEPYERRTGRPLAAAIAGALADSPLAGWRVEPVEPEGPTDYLYRRGRNLIRKRGAAAPRAPRPRPTAIRVAAIGPLGHVYLPRPLEGSALAAVGRRLVARADIPLVLYRCEGTVSAVNREGAFAIPADPAPVLGADHPALAEAAAGLVELFDHPDCGDLVISGWHPGEPPLSFATENGAHGGPGNEETRGFALLPRGLDPGCVWLRPADLRQIARQVLAPRQAAPPGRKAAAGSTVRVMSYNIHSCIGLDGRVAPERIARVIADAGADLVALQEVDNGLARTGGVDQAARLAVELDMEYLYLPLIVSDEGEYGIAVLSRLPLAELRCDFLPGVVPLSGREPRGVIWARVTTPAGALHLLNTHFGLAAAERQKQVEALLADQWLGGVPANEPVVLCGDFNAGVRSPVYRRLAARLADAQTMTPGAPKASFYARHPLLRIDHIFVSGRFEVTASGVVRSEEARRASDHLPVVADLRLAGRAALEEEP